MAETRKTARKKASPSTGKTIATRPKKGSVRATTDTVKKKPARTKANKDATKAIKKGAKVNKKRAAPTGEGPSPRRDDAFELWSLSTLPQQRQAGFALLVLSTVCILGIGVWTATDSLQSIGEWAIRAAIRGVCFALVVVCLWTILGKQRTVSGVLVISAGALGLLLLEAGTAWRADRARDLANRTLLQLENGRRDIESLTPFEKTDPYVEAYVIMRDIYWELYLRSDDEMSRYRSYYEDFTAGGTFLDVTRLTTITDIRRSMLQIEDLQRRLQRVEASRPDISDLLLSVSLLDVDDETRAVYADDLRTARDSFYEAKLETVARERETLRSMRHALEALLDAQGRYRIEGGKLIFDLPEDAARFVGKAERG